MSNNRRKSHVVTIIGMGPRGISILERLVSLSQQLGAEPILEIHVVDPGECGQGSHPSQQPAHLITNTIAIQTSVFAEDTLCRAGNGPAQASLTDWAKHTGYRRFAHGYSRSDADHGEEIGEYDYLPRAMLGEYLSWAFERIVTSMPPSFRLYQHRTAAVDVEQLADGQIVIQLGTGHLLRTDYVFLTTGHCRRAPTREDMEYQLFAQTHRKLNARLNYYPSAYPVETLDAIDPGSVVAVQGFGLTAHDTISQLTEGRGGRFARLGKSTVYHRSGREPKILLFSRNCLPFAARGVNQKGIAGFHKPAFLTSQAIARLRTIALARSGSPQLDFEKDILPLLIKEMTYAYHIASHQGDVASDEFEPQAAELQAIHQLFDPLQGCVFQNFSSFRKWFTEYVEADIAHAEMGNCTSPVKAATDVIRDTRESLREVVEFSGLTPASHRQFVEKYAPIMNRISFGPPRFRSHELLALMREGVIDLAAGPNPRVRLDPATASFLIESNFKESIKQSRADVLVIARLDPFMPCQDSSTLTQNLMRRGLVRPYLNGQYHPSGIDITTSCHPITQSGMPLNNVWAVGYLVEGPHFYTHALHRPRMQSRFVSDAHRCVEDLFQAILAANTGRNCEERRLFSEPTKDEVATS